MPTCDMTRYRYAARRVVRVSCSVATSAAVASVMISHANRKPITSLTTNTTLTAAMRTLNATPTAAVRDGRTAWARVADAVESDRDAHDAEHDEKPRRQRRHDVVDDEPRRRVGEQHAGERLPRGQHGRPRPPSSTPTRAPSRRTRAAGTTAAPRRGDRADDRQRMHDERGRKAGGDDERASSHLLHHTMSTRLRTSTIT